MASVELPSYDTDQSNGYYVDGILLKIQDWRWELSAFPTGSADKCTAQLTLKLGITLH